MEMFLMVVVMSFVALAITCVLFATATRDRGETFETRIDPSLALTPPQFFVDDRPPVAPRNVPIEALLLQIERHVRLEQAAAESFLDAPTATSLHCRTTSPLVH